MNPAPTPVAIVQTANPQAELAAAFTAFEQSGRNRLESALLIGTILAERKKACGHGNWLKWLEQYFPYGRERAADFLRVHANRGKCGRAATFEEALTLCRDEPAADKVPEQEPQPEKPTAPPRLDNKLPQPRIDASEKKPHPIWGNKKRPARKLEDHHFGEILVAMRNLSRMLTVAMNAPDGAKLKNYLRRFGLVMDRGFIFMGKKYNARFKGFQWRNAIKLAVGKGPELSKEELMKACLAEWEDAGNLEVPDDFGEVPE